MPPIEGIGASSASAALYQPRAQQSSAQTSGDETRGLSIQQYLQAGQQAGQDQGVQTQTSGAVVQAASTEQSQRNSQPAANDSSSTVLTLTQTLNRLSNVGSARPESANQPETSQPETSQTSALNYTASGTANPAQSPSDAGRRVSLSV